MVNKAVEAHEANEANKANKANEVDGTNEANEANEVNNAVEATEVDPSIVANEAVLGLLTLFLPFSLIKHSPIFAEVEGCFEFLDVNNNHWKWWGQYMLPQKLNHLSS